MIVSREQVTRAFTSYTAKYDENDEKVKLKVTHTFRVAQLCERIAKSENLKQQDIELAWLCGMLHDVGRFEQVKRYGTFNDAASIDHALLGVQILFEEGKIKDYVSSLSEQECMFLKQVIACHSAYRIPKEYDERTTLFSNILRDADKIDILKVNVEVPIEEIYNVTTEQLLYAEVSQEVMDSFTQEQATLRTLQKTPVDHVVGHISLVFELVYLESVAIVLEQGYLSKLLAFSSKNVHTMRQFAQLKQYMTDYLRTKGLQVSL